MTFTQAFLILVQFGRELGPNICKCSRRCTKRRRSRRQEEIEAWFEAVADASGANAYNFTSYITKADLEPHGHSGAHF